jgi:energy-coupling factor transport system ATP-binding protein
MEKIIEIKNVSFSYRRGETVTKAVKNVNLTVEKGEFIVILGRNGSGKSTLAKLLNGFLLPDEGSILVDGVSTADDKKIFELRSNVGMVFQNPDNQMVASIIEDDLAFGPENLGVPREEIRKRVDFALNAVNMLEYKHRTPERLSGGQKQRVAIAAVLSMLPKILIFDEATAMLDPKGRAEIMQTATKLNKEQGMTVMHITHYMNEAVNADKIVIMHDGEILACGKPSDVFRDAETVKKAGLELPVAAYVSNEIINLFDKDFKLCLTDEELAEEVLKTEVRG